MDLYGSVSVVTAEPLGDALLSAASLGAGAVTVYDASDFPELGGTVRVGGDDPAAQVVDYLSADPLTGVVTLATTLAAGWAVDVAVELWDSTAAAVYVDYRALVSLPGELDNADVLDCAINHALIPLLPEGIRDPGEGESVTITSNDGGSWTVTDIAGRTPQFDGQRIAPATVGPLQLTVDAGGVAVTIGATAPPTPRQNDLWFDANNGYQMNQWSGSAWVPSTFGTNAISAGAITADLVAANAIVAGAIAAGALDAQTITAGALTAGSISAGSIGASQIIASDIANCDMVIDPDGGSFLVYTLTGQTTVNLTTAGANTFTVPAGVTKLDRVETWGSSGGSQGSAAGSFGGCGSGGGEYAREDNLTVTPLSNIPYTIGAGGAAGASTGAAAGDGADTNFNNGQVVAHGGGGGGKFGSGISVGGGSGSTNTIHFSGGRGHAAGGTFGTAAGGGGSSAGSTRSGNDGGAPSAPATGGPGGAAVPDGAAGGAGRNGGGSGLAGTAGTAPGGGAGGAGGGTAAHTGGPGAAGKIRIKYAGARTLIASIAGMAGTDQYGNTYPAGVTFNNRAGDFTSTSDLASAGTTETMGYSQAINVTAGRRYKVTVRCFIGSAATSNAVVLSVRYSSGTVTNTSNQAGTSFTPVRGFVTTGSGGAVSTEFSREFVATATATWNVAIGVRTAAGGSGNSTIFGSQFATEIVIDDVGQ